MSPENLIEIDWGVVEWERVMLLAPGFCDGGEMLDLEGGVAAVEVAEDDVEGVEVRVEMVEIHGVCGVEAIMLRFVCCVA